MRKFAAMLLLVPASAQAAPTTPPAQAQSNGPDIVVTGENPVVCRHVTRTATRMRVGRVCRRQSDWQTDSDTAIRNGFNPNATIDGAADTLNVLGQQSTVRSDTALGPR